MPYALPMYFYVEGCNAEQALKRDLAKQNYLNIRDRKKRNRK